MPKVLTLEEKHSLHKEGAYQEDLKIFSLMHFDSDDNNEIENRDVSALKLIYNSRIR